MANTCFYCEGEMFYNRRWMFYKTWFW